MKNGVIKLTGFAVLNDIAKKHRVKGQDWAKATWGKPAYSSRISELRRMLKMDVAGDLAGIGRALTADKLKALSDGLKIIIGGDIVRKELIEKLNAVKTDLEKNLILLMVADEKDHKAIRMFLEAMIDKK